MTHNSMPHTLRLNDGGYMRRLDVHHLIHELYDLRCTELVGFSNVGKSALLKLLSQPDVWVQEMGEAVRNYIPVYIDCNRMLHTTGQGFYELVLRCIQEGYPEMASLTDLSAAYNTLISPDNEFQVPLSFNRGLTAVLRMSERRLVLFFDEFDEPFSQIDSRVFLNLRALQDRYNLQLVYMTATIKPLAELRHENHCTEFCELFSLHTWHLAPLVRADVDRQIRRYAESFDIQFTADDKDFIYEWAGGHPRMVEGVCKRFEQMTHQVTADQTNGISHVGEHWKLHNEIARRLRTDEYLTVECAKIWDECSEAEKKELISLNLADYKPNGEVIGQLVRRYLLLRSGMRHQPFCRLLAEFIQRQTAPSKPDGVKFWVDMHGGEVIVNGQHVETLTGLEYKLILFLFQNAEKIIDKFQIVTQVWGENYIDEVDDTRIEKLISRLRQKIEPDPTNPRFLTTVRGRGYRLVLT